MEPTSIAEAADMLVALRDKKASVQKELDSIKAEEEKLKAYVIDELPKSNATGVEGRYARVRVTVKPTPVVEDWSALKAHILATGEFDLLAKSISRTAVKERWSQDEEVPGIGVFNHVGVSLTKL